MNNNDDDSNDDDNNNSSSSCCIQQQQQLQQGYSEALLRTLAFFKVTLVRYVTCDAFNQLRCKAVPLKHLMRRQKQKSYASTSSTPIMDDPSNSIAFAQAVVAGLPTYADTIVKESGLTAQETLLLKVDVSTLRILPYTPSTACLFGNLIHSTTGLPSDLCTRTLLQRILNDKNRKQGGSSLLSCSSFNIGVRVGVELEFCLYDRLTNRPVDFSTFDSTLTLNRQGDFLQELLRQLDLQDIEVELVHAESAPGQAELVLCHCDNAVTMVDRTLLARETVVEVAHQHGLKAIFLPKIYANQAGNGMHLHLSIYDLATGRNLMGNTAAARTRTTTSSEETSSSVLSQKGQAFVEGILRHLPALVALTLPSANSFRRVGSGCWTGSQVAWACDDKEASLRVVGGVGATQQEQLEQLEQVRVEYKLCDSKANLYLALSGIVLAGLQGLEQNLKLRPSRNDPLPEFTSAQEEQTSSLPASFEESLDCLEQDEYLMSQLPKSLAKAYLAVRRAEAARSADMTLEEEVEEALERA